MRPGFVAVPIHICNIPGKSSKCESSLSVICSDVSVAVVVLLLVVVVVVVVVVLLLLLSLLTNDVDAIVSLLL